MDAKVLRKLVPGHPPGRARPISEQSRAHAVLGGSKSMLLRSPAILKGFVWDVTTVPCPKHSYEPDKAGIGGRDPVWMRKF